LTIRSAKSSYDERYRNRYWSHANDSVAAGGDGIGGVGHTRRLPIANDPHVDLPLFYIGVNHEGISPGDAERLLVQPMEIELRKLEGIVELRSTASEGMASFFIEFDVSQDLDKALNDVREAVDAARTEIPSTAEEPFVEEMTAADFPMLQVNLVGAAASERELYQAALKLRQEIETIPSVLSHIFRCNAMRCSRSLSI